MPARIIGMIGVAPPTRESTLHVIEGGISPPFIAEFAQAHEAAGYDMVLVGYTSSSAEGFLVAMHAAARTERLSYLVAHRPGFCLYEGSTSPLRRSDPALNFSGTGFATACAAVRVSKCENSAQLPNPSSQQISARKVRRKCRLASRLVSSRRFLNDGSGAQRTVPAAKAERRLWVQLKRPSP